MTRVRVHGDKSLKNMKAECFGIVFYVVYDLTERQPVSYQDLKHNYCITANSGMFEDGGIPIYYGYPYDR